VTSLPAATTYDDAAIAGDAAGPVRFAQAEVNSFGEALLLPLAPDADPDPPEVRSR
jgi:hypothetical protein